ncbi:Cytotoxic and regulatory T-cell molecule [Holothuria leucospilota]|uniref:Cytotoxic and regulatory T-cell molecule n=1 Tax=Holothuria leucospilota TaxID=206669 RepID=A0A9Q1BCL5_HOLLE|nr:Cytotoxic and regulatory T-cell molecule [Holothuria leucospilota]
MKLCHMVFIIFKVCNVQTEERKTVSDQFYLDTRVSVLTVREGTKVTLTCSKSSSSVIHITFILGERYFTLIDSSNVTDISHKYGFNDTKSNEYAFTINRISRNDEGVYQCYNGLISRTRAITVIYGPSERSPQCSSNYNSPIIFYDEINDDRPIVFNCSTERGKPPVTVKIYFNGQEVTSHLEITNETRTDKESMLTVYSLSQHVNDTLQNRHFVCNVTQPLPSPYDDYHGSCSFGPLHLLPGFSLSVSPSNVTVRDEDNVILTCTSNVTGVNITWNNTPSEKYIVTNYNRSSVLTILSFKPASNGTVFVECSGSYGSRTVTANTSLFLMVNEEEPEDENYMEDEDGHIIKVSVVIIGSLIIGVTAVALFICWNKKKNKGKPTNTSPGNNGFENISMSNHHDEEAVASTQESNINNANNTAISPEDDGMFNNIIYEHSTYGNMTELVEDDKIKRCKNVCYEIENYGLGDDHIICENVIYQSV